jgi:predicted enzyme related to lactoylglutathione lyase
MKLPVNTINWFEIPVNDFNRAKQFYNHLFDYEMPEAPSGANRRGFLPHDVKAGGIGGAIVQGPDYVPSQRGCLVYLNAGDDLNIVLARAKEAGASIVQERTPVSEEQELGFYAIIRDSEGNRIALHAMH